MVLLTSQANRASAGIENDFILANGCRHFRYSLNKEGETEIRVVPSFTDGVPDPILNPGNGPTIFEALSGAIGIADVAFFLGPGKAHMICPSYPGEKRGPVHTLVYTILDAAENDPKGCDDKWLRWCGKGADRPKNVMARPSQVMMMQGYLMKHKGRPCVDKEGNEVVRSPVLLILNRSATNDMEEKLSTPMDDNGAWGANNNLLGDFTSLEAGRVLRFSPYQKEHNNREQTWYRADLAEEYPLTIDEAISVWKPWPQVVNCAPSLAEVGIWLMKAFDASTVVKIFENHPTYCECITDTIRRAADKEDAAAVGRTTVGYGYPPQPMPPQPQPMQRQYPPQPQVQRPVMQQQQPPPDFNMLGTDADSPFDQMEEEEAPAPRQDVSIANRARAIRRAHP